MQKNKSQFKKAYMFLLVKSAFLTLVISPIMVTKSVSAAEIIAVEKKL